MIKNYFLIDTPDKLKELDKKLIQNGKPVFQNLAYDTETNGLDIKDSTAVGFSISSDRYSGYYVPLLKWIPDKNSLKSRKIDKKPYQSYIDGHLECVWTGEKFPEFVKPHEYSLRERFPVIPALMERWLCNGYTKLWMHNGPFDCNITRSSAHLDLTPHLALDTALLLHVLDENEPTALKKALERYRKELRINPYAIANEEQRELIESIRKNGGKKNEVWRADLGPQAKYGASDTIFTFGLGEETIKQLHREYKDRGMIWFFNQEVMPLCREVVTDMKYKGVCIDVPHFEKLNEQCVKKMDELEDKLITIFEKNGYLREFPLGKSLDKAVSNQRLIKKLIELEDLSVPTKLDKKSGQHKETLAKGVVKKVYEQDPHWVWGYILGEDEIKYSDKKLNDIKNQLYREVEGRRYRFNIGSRDHLRWLFCDHLGLRKDKLPQTASATKDNPIPSISADVLKEFMLPRWEWVKDLMLWKKLQKIESTYIRPALNLHKDGWLYMNMKQNGTTSGRFSCSGGYNLQTLPRAEEDADKCPKCGGEVDIKQEIEVLMDRKCKECGHEELNSVVTSAIKKGFIAPPGYKIVTADYSSLEPRCFAYMSGDKKLVEVYQRGLDLYSKVYCDVFDSKGEYSADPAAPNFLKKVAKDKRTFIKPIVLGIPYGAQEDQVANLIGAKKQKTNYKCVPQFDEDGEPIMVADFEEGKRVRDAYLSTYEQLNIYMETQDRRAVELGYVETIVGRRRHLPYAKKINDVLKKYNVDYRALEHGHITKLGQPETEYKVSNGPCAGQRVRLTSEMLEEIKNSLGVDKKNYAEKGYWKYVRALLKNDLNNAKNNPIQGLAGHITNMGMLDTTRLFKQHGIDGWVFLQVHDEIMTYVREDQAELGKELLKQGMEKNEFTALLKQKPELALDMEADPVICDTLKESK